MFSEALSLHGSLLLIDSSFLKQGVVYGASQCVSGRILLTCTWYFVIIVFSMYVANLAAYFTGKLTAVTAVSTLLGNVIADRMVLPEHK